MSIFSGVRVIDLFVACYHVNHVKGDIKFGRSQKSTFLKCNGYLICSLQRKNQSELLVKDNLIYILKFEMKNWK